MGRSVLVVDSDRNLCQVMAKALEAAGYRVGTASDGDRALAAVAGDPPDLLLLDLFLPGRDGFAVLEAIRGMPGEPSRLPVVLLSGCSPTPEYSRRAQLLDAAALLSKPVPLEDLKAVVVKQIGEAKPAVPRASRARGARRDLAGRLERFSLAALLHHLHGLRATGVLHLQRGRKRKWIQLRDGYPTSVRSNLVGECLGNYLVRSGRIDEATLEESRRRMGNGKRQGEILVAMDVLSEEEVSDALREHAEAKLFEAFSWPGGAFRFDFGGELERASGLARRSPANLILRGVREHAPLEVVDAWIEAERGARLTRSRKSFYRFQEIDLSDEHRQLVESLERSRPLAEFLHADELSRRTVYALVRTGILELAEGSAPEPASAPSGRAHHPSDPPHAHDPEAEEAKSRELAALAERFAGQGFFEILGVSETADASEVEAAYEQLAEEVHPDRVAAASAAVHQLATQVFRQVERAYETLADPKRRQEYLLDRKRADRESAAREESRRAVEAELHFQEGEAALRQRAYEVALRCFGRSLELYPDEGEYHAHYGWTLHLCHPDEVQIAEEAIEHVKRGIKLAPDREKPYLLMGRLCKAIGRVGAAERMFTRAAQIQPDCVEALREIRLINMRREKQKGFIGRLLRR